MLLQRSLPTQLSSMVGPSLLSSIPSDDDSIETDYSIGDISLISGSESTGSICGDSIPEFEETAELKIDNLFELKGIEGEESSAVDVETTSGQQVVNSENRTQNLELQESSTCDPQSILSNAAEDTSQEADEPNDEMSATPTGNFGYVLVIDNLDMNIRRSYQRVNRTTESYHFCHAYAVLNRINTSLLSDAPSSGELSVDYILPNEDDLKKIIDDITVLASRYACTLFEL